MEVTYQRALAIEFQAHGLEFGREDFVQILGYLKASRIKTGLLLNFGSKMLGIKRFAN